MGKSCLDKLTSNITVGCTINPVGVKAIYLMHAEEVTFAYTNIPKRLVAATFASGAKSYLVEGYKQNIQVNGSLALESKSAAEHSSGIVEPKTTESVLLNKTRT